MTDAVSKDLFNQATGALAGMMLAKESDVLHLIKNGVLVNVYIDLEATDKEWQYAEITTASVTATDIGLNIFSEHASEVNVPDRVGLSPEAMEVTRYLAEDVRDPSRLSPQRAAAQIFDAVQKAPRRLWDALGRDWRHNLGEDLWHQYVDERVVKIPAKTGGDPKPVIVRHLPMLNDQGQVVKNVRVHAPKWGKDDMKMSYLCEPGEKYDYSDEFGNWRVRKLDKNTLGFRNRFFDNRLMAAALYRANFPLKLIYFLNKKGLGNHAVDLFTAALHNHFFSLKGRTKLALAKRRDPETSEERVSAKQDLLFKENTRFGDPDVALPPGVRVANGTLLNIKLGHNKPDYDNLKSIGEHAYLRDTDPESMAEIEMSGDVDRFRDFMTKDIEDGVPTTHPIRFAVISANDPKIYRAAPLIILGSDDQHGKFNRIWGMRADIDYSTYRAEPGGKLVPEMTAEEIARLINMQRGSISAVFHEISVKRPPAVTSLERGVAAGYCTELATENATPLEILRYRRSRMVDYIDENNVAFVQKVLDGFGKARAFKPPADDSPPPYPEQEIWTGMGDVKYPFVDVEGETIRLPNIIRAMAQDEFKRVNDQIGDTMREFLRQQTVEQNSSTEERYAYVVRRNDLLEKLERYQSLLPEPERVVLPPACYTLGRDKAFWGLTPIEQINETILQDRHFLMYKVPETTRAYEVQQLLGNGAEARWQTIPFKILAGMKESRLNALKDDARLRVRFERNPTQPTVRFALREFMENDGAPLLTKDQRTFYKQEAAFYINGPAHQDPDKHVLMTVPKQLRAIERQRQNIRPGSKDVSASRNGETGAYEIFAGGDMADAHLNSVERDAKRRQVQNPGTPEIQARFGVDPATGRPILQPHYEIGGKPLVIKVPDGFADHTGTHAHIGHTAVILPRIAGLTRAQHIILEEEGTGRRHYAAEPVVQPLPSRTQGGFDTFYQSVDKPYLINWKTAPEDGYALSCAELAPVHDADPRALPAIGLEQDKLFATRSPHLGNLGRDEPLQGFAQRQYDLALKPGDAIRLRGKDAKEKDTGWEAKTTVTNVTNIALGDLVKMIRNPATHERADRLAWIAGYANGDDLMAHMIPEATDFDDKVSDPEIIITFVEFETPERIYYWTPKQPRAAFAPLKPVPTAPAPTPELVA